MQTFYVKCYQCGHSFNADLVNIISVEEDIQGRDIYTFECPHCGEDSKSYPMRSKP